MRGNNDDLLLCHARRVSMSHDCPTCGAAPGKLCQKLKRQRRNFEQDWDRGVSNRDFGPEGML